MYRFIKNLLLNLGVIVIPPFLGLAPLLAQNPASQEQIQISSIQFLDGHQGIVRAIAIDPDARYVASGGEDGRVIVRDRNSLEVEQTHVFQGPVITLAFERGGGRLWVGGELERPLRQVVSVIDLDGQTSEFLSIPARGTVLSLHRLDENLVFLTAGMQIGRLNIVAKTVAEIGQIFGGFIGAIAVSPDGQRIAVTSQNEVDLRSAMPCVLTVFEANGQVSLRWEYAFQHEYQNSHPVFITPDLLLNCIPASRGNQAAGFPATPGRIKRWSWNSRDERWSELEDLPVQLRGKLTAITHAADEQLIWAASSIRLDETVLYAVGADDGVLHVERPLEIGYDAQKPYPRAFAALQAAPNGRQLFGACRDGRVMVVSYARVVNEE